MMHDLFTRSIDVKTKANYAEFEDAPELYKETELGWIPKKWEVRLMRLDTLFLGLPSSNISDYWNGSIIWVTPADLSKLKFGYIADSERKITSFGLKNSSASIDTAAEYCSIFTSTYWLLCNCRKRFYNKSGVQKCRTVEGNSAEVFLLQYY